MGLIEEFHMANILYAEPIQYGIAQLVLSGVFERYPKLKMVISEWGTNWVPAFMDNIDGSYSSRTEALTLKKLPSEYMMQNIWFTFDRPLGLPIAAVERLSDRLLWASDFPHIESTWPESRKAFDGYTEGLSESTREKVAHRTCAALYGIEVLR